MRAILIIVVIALLVGLGLIAFRAGDRGGVPKLVIDTPFVDFGEIPPEKTTRTIVLRNAGTGDLMVKQVTTSCNCTTAALSSDVIPPSGLTELMITFDPEVHATEGKVMRLVWIDSNDPEAPHAEVEFRVKVVR
ncbi:MAG: hypothetical protein A2Z04_08150 [Chloroflexi bacterium RBG_16_57_9]|nr:MAG: hypothetical protein A2Z04_08150 [Chloroflexi bacterium RBG_16_57_9]